MQVDISPESDHPPLEDNFTIESATLVGKTLHLFMLFQVSQLQPPPDPHPSPPLMHLTVQF